MERLLPTPYFHMVFTLPHTLNPLVLQNNETLYNLLFHAASNALLELAKGYSRLRAQVGFTAVLHTWKQDLGLHPHVHIVVTAGGLHPCGDWIASKNNFFLPVKALSKIFRAKFLQALNDAFRQQALSLSGKIQYLKNPKNFNRLIRTLKRKKWIVYSKKPFHGPQHAFAYISRYTHRVAISNSRLLSLSDQNVTFRTRDNCATYTINPKEFIRRFLLHVLPKGFVRIRHYGLLAPCNAKTKLEKARLAILKTNPQARHYQISQNQDGPPCQGWKQLMKQLTGVDVDLCPKCKTGNLIRIDLDSPIYPKRLTQTPVAILDSS
jgi:hypothetical protein